MPPKMSSQKRRVLRSGSYKVDGVAPSLDDLHADVLSKIILSVGLMHCLGLVLACKR